MSIRYIQAAVSTEDHRDFAIFACQHDITLSDLVGLAVRAYIEQKRKEEKAVEEAGNGNN